MYDYPLVETYRWLANASVSTAAAIGYIKGPAGMRGKILNLSFMTTTATTVAASTIMVGNDGDADSILTLDVPVAAAKLGTAIPREDLIALTDLSADTVYLVSGGGEATAGAGDVTLTVGWF
jgi:hypothetical protein